MSDHDHTRFLDHTHEDEHQRQSGHRQERGRDNPDTTIVINVDDDDTRSGSSRLERLIIKQADRIIYHIQKAEQLIMGKFDALSAAVAEDTTVTQSVITLLDGIAQQIADLIAAGTVDAAELQNLVDQITANSATLSEAVTANTPVTDPEVPEEPETPEEPVTPEETIPTN